MRFSPFRLFALLMTVVISGCAFDAEEAFDDEEDDDEHETPGEAVSEELRSAVDCTPRRATAYVKGVPRTINVITVGGKPVAKPAGHAFLRMQKAADAAGVRLSLTSGFRTMEQQKYLYNCYLTKRCNNGNLAARPGYSNHQSGIALDVSTSRWLASNASRFGFVRTVPSEAWHYEFRGADPGGACSGK